MTNQNPTQVNQQGGLIGQLQASAATIVGAAIVGTFNGYMQVVVTNGITAVQNLVSRVQQIYCDNAESLYKISLDYGNGIIAVNSDTFLMNLGLAKKVGNVKNNPGNIDPQVISNLNKQVGKTFKLSAKEQIVIVTIANPAISVRIPMYSSAINIPQGNGLYMIDDNITILVSGDYFCIDNKKNSKKYLFKRSKNEITWFYYVDLVNFYGINLTPTQVRLGNKDVTLETSDQGVIASNNPLPTEENPWKITYLQEDLP